MENPYYLAASFANERKAGEAYFPMQQIIFDAQDLWDLSVYRFTGWTARESETV